MPDTPPPHINAVALCCDTWPSDHEFPFTPEECLWILKGFAVKPASGPLTRDDYRRLPGRFERTEGRLALGRT